MIDYKPRETPIIAHLGFHMIKREKVADRGQYQRIIGKFIYLPRTRLGIAYAIGVVNMFMHQPLIQHITSFMRILRYLKGTSSRGIFYKKNWHLDLLAYTDADWAGDRDDKKSTSKYITLVRGNLVTWNNF